MNNKLLLIWKEPKSRRRYVIGILSNEEDRYYFNYVDPELNDAKLVGFSYFPGFPDVNFEYTSNQLFANIKTRLPNEKRTDYLDIMNSYDIKANAPDMEILMKTRGRLVTDNFEFVMPFDKDELDFEIAGTSHSEDLKKCKNNIKVNSKLYLEMEPENISDKYAIAVVYKECDQNYTLGYVPRYYSKDLTEALKEAKNYSALVKATNFGSPMSDEDITTNVKLIFNK